MNYLEQYHKLIVEFLYDAKKTIEKEKYKLNDIKTKANYRDLVTPIDKMIEKKFIEIINKNYPSHYIIGEENFKIDEKVIEENLWTVDPIDGTTNFVKQKKDYCILISFFQNRIPKLSYIFDIERNELIYSIEGKGVFINNKKIKNPENLNLQDALITIDVRRMWKTSLLSMIIEKSFDIRHVGCSGIDGAKVIRGEFGGFISPEGGFWDYAPLILMAKELGLHMSDLKGGELPFYQKSGFILSTKQIYNDIKSFL